MPGMEPKTVLQAAAGLLAFVVLVIAGIAMLI